MNITFVTTVNHNIGDDFIREGIKFLLESKLKSKPNYQHIHKHMPVTARGGFEWVRNYRLNLRLEKYLPKWITPDKVQQADLVINSGAPAFWLNQWSHAGRDSEWAGPIFWDRVEKYKKPFWNVAVGTCQAYHSDGSELVADADMVNYMKRLRNMSQVFTVRDNLTSHVFNTLGIEHHKIACSSIFAKNYYKLKSDGEDYVVVNFMKGGGHYNLDGSTVRDKWTEAMISVISHIEKNHKIVFSCHNQPELDAAKEIFPQHKVFYSNNYVDYLKLYSKASFGLVNRIHAGFPLASFGKPVILVGNDSRARMGELINIDNRFVDEVNAADLIEAFEQTFSKSKTISDHYFELQNKYYLQYMEVFTL